MQRKAFVVTVVVVAFGAVVGVGAWQIVATRSELHTTQRQLAALTKSDARKLAVEKAKDVSEASALAAARHTVNSLLNTPPRRSRERSHSRL